MTQAVSNTYILFIQSSIIMAKTTACFTFLLRRMAIAPFPHRPPPPPNNMIMVNVQG